MISFELLREEGIVIIEPSGALEKADFDRLTREVDAYINEKGYVNGFIIHTKEFPGWKSFEAFTHHMHFVKEHHTKIRRVAVAADSKFMSIAPTIANHFVSAEIRHFDYTDTDAAKKWILEGK
jgi:tRNA U38,U39,U40 pseudouridine synthase TruA